MHRPTLRTAPPARRYSQMTMSSDDTQRSGQIRNDVAVLRTARFP